MNAPTIEGIKHPVNTHVAGQCEHHFKIGTTLWFCPKSATHMEYLDLGGQDQA